MRPWRLAAGLALAALLLGWLPARADQERILAFDSRVDIASDGELTVTETIRVLATGAAIRHGIVREFPTRYTTPAGTSVSAGFRLVSTRQDGRRASSRTVSAGNGKKIYIGDSDRLVAPGVHVYEIVYHSDGQIGQFDNHDELFWNVTGNGWRLPIDRATATVTPPPGAPAEQFTAYTGPPGARGRDFTEERQDRAVRFATTAPLPPGQGLSVVVSWPKGFVRLPPPRQRMAGSAAQAQALALVGLVTVAVYFFLAWLVVGRDPKAGTRIPLFAPPDGVDAPDARYLWRMGFDNATFAAGLVQMAVAGGLRLEEKDGVFTVVRGKTAFPAGSWQGTVAAKLLRGNSTVRLKQANHTAIAEARQRLRQHLRQRYKGSHFRTNTGAFVLGVLLSLAVLALVALRCQEPAAAIGMSVGIAVWTFALSALTIRAWRAVRAARRRTSLLTLLVALFMVLFAVPFFAGEIVGLAILTSAVSVPAAFCLAVMAGLNGLFWYLLKAPTKAGRRVLDALDGFRMYLSIGEKQRLELLNPPERTPALFEKFLPYALALGVANSWAAQFEDVLQRAAAQEAYTPAWYLGPTWSDHDFGGFADNLGDAFSGAIAAAATAPGSTSGFSSGSGSGGGGGGGGGGGW